MTPINSFYFLLSLLVLFNADNALAQIQEHRNLGDANDCPNIAVDYANNPNLTQQEKIELMDKALFHSLNKYKGCQNIHTSDAGGGKAGGGKAGDRGANGTQSGAGSAAGNGKTKSSAASSEMSGTQAPVAQETSTGSSSETLSNKTETNTAPGEKNNQGRIQNKYVRGSGKIPDDIPEVDNDSILEAQIRQAAIDETDPAIKAKLWNEYRKYKGLPVQ